MGELRRTTYGIHPNRSHDVLKLLLASVLEGQVEFVADLLIRRVGDADASRLSNRFEPGCYVHAVAQDIFPLDQYVSKIDADTEEHSAILGHIGIPLCHELLNRHRAFHRGDDGREFQQDAIAGGLDDSAAMSGHDRIDCGTMFPEDPGRARLVSAHEPTVAGDISRKNGGQSSLGPLPGQAALRSNRKLSLRAPVAKAKDEKWRSTRGRRPPPRLISIGLWPDHMCGAAGFQWLPRMSDRPRNAPTMAATEGQEWVVCHEHIARKGGVELYRR